MLVLWEKHWEPAGSSQLLALETPLSTPVNLDVVFAVKRVGFIYLFIFFKYD